MRQPRPRDVTPTAPEPPEASQFHKSVRYRSTWQNATMQLRSPDFFGNASGSRGSVCPPHRASTPWAACAPWGVKLMTATLVQSSSFAATSSGIFSARPRQDCHNHGALRCRGSGRHTSSPERRGAEGQANTALKRCSMPSSPFSLLLPDPAPPPKTRTPPTGPIPRR